ncbi:MAG TPA: maleylpyruvate isomerase family mycothiol-dependent enzyme [Acidimicrobiales bacterium]|jgi:uncharacterized protein (TIGR03083 family)|nr:maleylpyruvate isomerase family mycothiol-dependent enzyme [Acidimicrobiales bacterium]
MSPAVSPSIDHLELAWRSVESLCADLTEAQWNTPTGCPGWSVKDNLSHLVDYEARALGRAGPDHAPADVSHTKNPLGESNEVGVDFRRAASGATVLDEFREVTAARSEQLRALRAEDLRAEMVTPAGPGTLADMLTLRVMDTWSHEQDIRRALGRPGHVDGPAVVESVEYWARVLPLIVAKRAAASDGSTVLVEVGDVCRRSIAVEGGRASVVDGIAGTPTVALKIPAATFAALVGGRSDAPDDVLVEGDEALGRAIVAKLGFMP